MGNKISKSRVQSLKFPPDESNGRSQIKLSPRWAKYISNADNNVDYVGTSISPEVANSLLPIVDNK